MSKVIKGKELFKMIAEGEIDENTKVTVDNYGECTLGFVFEDGRNLFKWIDEDFELIEDKIDIDKIEEVSIVNTSYKPIPCDMEFIAKKFNELIQAAKQLDKEVKEISKRS